DENATGFVEVKSGDSVSNIALENGEGTLAITLPYGSYTLDVTYLGDANYNKNSTKCEFTLVEPAKENTPISLDIVTEENNVTITAIVNDAATGLVKFQVTGEEEYTLYADVINGKAVLEDILVTGDYTVVATYMGDNRFNTNITYADFTIVGHIKKDTPITARADVNGNRVTITVNVDENATGFVKLTVGGTVANIEVVDGVATLTTTLAPNSYLVDVTYLGDDNYNVNSTKVTFTVTEVSKQNTTIDLNIIADEDTALVMVDLDKSATGLVKFYMVCKETGEEYTMYMDVIDGHVETFTNSIAPGNYTVVATYMGDSVFNTNTTSKDVEILGHVMKDTPIDVTVETNANRVILTVNVDENATGFVEVKSGVSVSNIALENGEGTLTITLPYGSYTLDVTYLGDANYNKNSTKCEFTLVEPAKDDTPISLDIVTDENNVKMTVTVDEIASGLVKFQITGPEDYTIYADVIKGKAVLEYVLLSGDYTVVATYMGDEWFNTNITSEDFTVVGHIKKDTPITAGADVNGNRVTITVNVDENATGFVRLTVGGTVANIEVVDGVATITTTLLPNSYLVDVTYLGDDNFNMNSTKVTFTVTEASKENTPINLNVTVNESSAMFKVDLNKAATGLVKFYLIGDESGENSTMYVDVKDGSAELVVNGIAPGNYSVVAIYMGDDVFNSNVTSSQFSVSDHVIENTTFEVEYTVDHSNVTITIKSNVDGEVTVYLDNVESKVILENGTASFTVPSMDYGEHSLVIVYPGDRDHTPAVNVTPIYIEGFGTKFTNITVVKETLTAVLSLATGDPLANQSITYIIDGVEAHTSTDENGQFTIQHVLDKVLTIKYEGNVSFLPTGVELNLRSLVPKRIDTEILGENYEQYAVDYYAGERGQNFTTQLVDANGKPLANKTVYIGCNGVLRERTTDENGFTSVQINFKDKNRLTFAVVFLGDEDYTGSVSVYLIVIKKKPVTMTTPAKSYKVATKTKSYTVSLKTIKGASADGKTYFGAGQKVTLKVNGKTYTAKTNAKGQATFKITNLKKKGKFTALIKFAGSTTYNAVSKKAILTIK
ncbi:Ig-like domain repeat protein, partial [Methanobrevibacter sp.]|uniref:Ig-like domain-containing protein n=1 Tax=Methanobrevibacter sp. TaxID=66852 RepID=UPI003891183F